MISELEKAKRELPVFCGHKLRTALKLESLGLVDVEITKGEPQLGIAKLRRQRFVHDRTPDSRRQVDAKENPPTTHSRFQWANTT